MKFKNIPIGALFVDHTTGTGQVWRKLAEDEDHAGEGEAVAMTQPHASDFHVGQEVMAFSADEEVREPTDDERRDALTQSLNCVNELMKKFGFE